MQTDEMLVVVLFVLGVTHLAVAMYTVWIVCVKYRVFTSYSSLTRDVTVSYSAMRTRMKNEGRPLSADAQRTLFQSYIGKGVVIFDLCCPLLVIVGCIHHWSSAPDKGQVLFVSGLYGGVVATIVVVFQVGLQFKAGINGYAIARDVHNHRDKSYRARLQEQSPTTSWLSHCIPRPFEVGSTIGWPAWATIISVCLTWGATSWRLVTHKQKPNTDEQIANQMLSSIVVLLVVVCLISALVYRMVKVYDIRTHGGTYFKMATRSYAPVRDRVITDVNLVSYVGDEAASPAPDVHKLFDESDEDFITRVNIEHNLIMLHKRYDQAYLATQVLYPCCGLISLIVFVTIAYTQLQRGCILSMVDSRSSLKCPMVLWSLTVGTLGATNVIRAATYLYRNMTFMAFRAEMIHQGVVSSSRVKSMTENIRPSSVLSSNDMHV
jgi:hypothetical protein